ncbi:mRNA-capping enzyme [Tolypocladium paradoxum]|uniref:mRNA-capping enzyme n=1 Tax=Tolypocladium paradoxum TaxID=94208 RepID=A0A2S4KY42_9HYPO|nr:mRNA-capping enzyme [Tolypocladium paradoxum]
MAGAGDSPDVNSTDPHATDPLLLKNNSEFKSYKTSRFEYPDIRVFFRQHAKARELPAPLPLLVCIPGLGGSVAQFHQLLSSLVDLAPCLAIDYPGGGRSRYALTSWDAYTPQALLELLETVIEDYRDTDAGQSVVLIGHSMGTALAARLANKKASRTTQLADHVVGLVAICPTSGPWCESTATVLRRLLWIPGWMFALWRAWDGMRGPQSPSVARFVGEGAEPELKLLQYRFNQQSLTPVWRRMAYGALPVYQDGKPIGGIPGLDTWAGLDIPVYLIAGEKDHLTPPKEVDKIVEAMGLASNGAGAEATEQPGLQSAEAAAPVSLSLKPQDHMPDGSDGLKTGDLAAKSIDQTDILDDPHDDPSTPLESESSGSLASPAPLPVQPRHPLKVVQSIVIPAPANHTLLYMPRSARALAGLISDFLATNITGRLSLAWQLQYLSREGKWDVKNLIKWKSVAPVSELIGPQGRPIFRAMKTLREADDVHCPTAFVEQWGSIVKDVIDISKDQPVYDPRGLERGGVHYHKFSTVSKIPPRAHEVEAFIDLVDKLRDAQKERAVAEAWEDAEKCVVGVHCHYGFNRTGYFIVCYLVERCGFALSDAIEAFARARPNGIRHSHFLDRLYVRYNIDEARG